MRTFSEFQIIGHVGKVKAVGPTLRVDIAAEYGRKDETGEFRSNPYWNEVTLFGERLVAWAKENVKAGDLVHARGTVRQTRYEKDGQTVYGVTFAADDFDLLAPKALAPA
ncbi:MULTISPECIES: single-stranded DNA-binding protein [Rubellimicrobium]|uniref:Single-stranded DNA-binding protein n=2 Tax=Rubellimicrobium TaxID=295418 RepID=A0A5C4NCJ4_9RHOB|nr:MULTISPECIES: single-stranded DNA-binding protein [Rubellimicrobium]MBP1807676.1 single-stranded DNA-binding protein [Rubellimicrobium aerolatum]TNC66402.1 single-stranded DNA-binding protein [Rubellimicrobium roseum]